MFASAYPCGVRHVTLLVCPFAAFATTMTAYNRKDAGGIFNALPALKDRTVAALQSVNRFKGNLAITLEIIRTLVFCFMVLPNNVLYLLDHTYGNMHRLQGPRCAQDSADGGHGEAPYTHVYIRSGICLIVLGCISLVVCVVFSYFASASKWKLGRKKGLSKSVTDSKSTVIVMLCLAIGNIELVMSVVDGCMELLYRPLVDSLNRWHNMECSVAIMNILVVVSHVWGSMMIIRSILGNKNELEETELTSPTLHYPQGHQQALSALQYHQQTSSAPHYPPGRSLQQYQSSGYSSYQHPALSGIQQRSDSTVAASTRQF